VLPRIRDAVEIAKGFGLALLRGRITQHDGGQQLVCHVEETFKA